MPFFFAWKVEDFHFSDMTKRQTLFFTAKTKPTSKSDTLITKTKVQAPRANNTTNVTNESNGSHSIESAYNDVLDAELAIIEIEKEAGIKTPLRHLRSIKTNRKVVALTFDDGPHPVFTAQILRVLDYYKAKATFFLVGSIAEHYPLWVGMETHANHTVASHTYSHLRLDFLDEEETQYQLEHNQEVLSILTNSQPKYFRPPGGRFNAQAARIVDKLNLTLVWWTCNTNDLAGYNSEYIVNRVKEGLKPGAIFLLHDGNQTTVDALPQILEYIKSQGYQMVSIEELDRISGMPPRKVVETKEIPPETAPAVPSIPEQPKTNPDITPGMENKI